MWSAATTILHYLYLSLAASTALLLSLYMLSFVVPKASFAARTFASYICLLLASVIGVLASLAFRPFGFEGSTQWFAGRALKHLMFLTTGVTFEIQDPHNVLNTTRPAVFIGNHQTELDVLMLGCMFPQHCSVTAKASLRKVPFLGWFMSLSRTIFIDRANSKDARQAMKGAADEIKRRRQSVYMFPEGTRSYTKDPILLPFKKGAFHLAVEAGVPIIPCVVANYSHVLWIKGLVFRSGKIPVRVLEPISTKNYNAADVEDLTREIRERMLKELVTLSSEAQRIPMRMSAHADPKPTTKSGVSTTVEAL